MSQGFIPTIIMNADGTESVENVPVMSINETNAFFGTSVNNPQKITRADIIRNKLRTFKPKTRGNS